MRTRIGYDGTALPDRQRVSADDMAAELPEPETCGTCAHAERCLGLGYTRSLARTSCDFLPVRFARHPSLAPAPSPAATPEGTCSGAPHLPCRPAECESASECPDMHGPAEAPSPAATDTEGADHRKEK